MNPKIPAGTERPGKLVDDAPCRLGGLADTPSAIIAPVSFTVTTEGRIGLMFRSSSFLAFPAKRS
jgi:hypothetical protein